ncbi:MAG TPA: ISNCY family transposase [bacterium]|nr:ISNCY family transposase [bacterium]
MTRETIALTQVEQRRAIVLTQLGEHRIDAAHAAALLDLSVRHCRRLLAAFRRRGPAALAHGNRGRPASNRVPRALERRIVRLARTRYVGFNHQHLTEKLAEDHAIVLSRPTVHRILLAAGLPSPHPRRRRRFRRRRERMPLPGLLLQWDGSHHDWLQGRGPRLVLHGAIDDATSDVPAAIIRTQEDAQGYFTVLRQLVCTHGIPVALYCDRHGIVTNDARPRPLTLNEQLRGHTRPPTQVGRALHELGIQWIPAHSPQAKGRIERLWGTFQDRLVSELRLAQARTLEEANAVLRAFLPRYNARFTRPAAQPGSAYRALPPDLNLDDVCCFAYERTVANDNTVTLDAQRVQLLPDAHRASYAKGRVIVRRHLDGRYSVSHGRRRIAFRILTAPPHPAPSEKPTAGRPVRPRVPSSWKPSPDHPWKKTYAQEQRRKQLRMAGVTFSLNA